MQALVEKLLAVRFAGVLLLAPPILALFGPFGTYSDLSFWPRLLYWSILIIGIGTLMIGTVSVVLTWERTRQITLISKLLISTGVAALPGAGLVLLVYVLLRPESLALRTGGFPQLWIEVWVLGFVGESR